MEPVFAYIDPGSGSLIVQALIAGIVAVPIFFRHQISRAVRVLRGQGQQEGSAATPRDDAKPGR